VLAEDGSAPIGQGFRPPARSRGSSSRHKSPSPRCCSSAAPCLSKSFSALLAADRGYEPSNLLTARIGFLGTACPPARAAFYNDVLTRVTAIRRVTHAGFTSSLPTASPNWKIPVGLRPGDKTRGSVDVETVSDRHRRLLRLDGYPRRERPGFTAQDTITSEPVIVVNQSFAHRCTCRRPSGRGDESRPFQYPTKRVALADRRCRGGCAA
jgi:hypothetical protein